MWRLEIEPGNSGRGSTSKSVWLQKNPTPENFANTIPKIIGPVSLALSVPPHPTQGFILAVAFVHMAIQPSCFGLVTVIGKDDDQQT